MLSPRFAACCLILSLLGCGGAAPPANREPVFQVTGKVTHKGKPVVGADVTFKSETSDRSSFGRTDDQGVYQLSTFGANDGAVAGKHTVLISKSVVATPTVPEAPVESTAYVPPGYETVKAAPKVDSGFPAKYADPKSSGLIAIVNGDGAPNEVNFDLKN